jgi:hypothetical protein
VELYPASARVERALRLGDRILVAGIQAAERNEAPAGRRRGVDQMLVRLAVAIGLVEREDDSAGAGELDRLQQFLRRRLEAVGVVLADVSVRIEDLEARDEADRLLEPRPQVGVVPHGPEIATRRTIRPMDPRLVARFVAVSRAAIGVTAGGVALGLAAAAALD